MRDRLTHDHAVRRHAGQDVQAQLREIGDRSCRVPSTPLLLVGACVPDGVHDPRCQPNPAHAGAE